MVLLPLTQFSSIEDLQPQETEPTDDSVTYHVSTNGSNRNKMKLADSIGYTGTHPELSSENV
jgi:hypothetical protein